MTVCFFVFLRSTQSAPLGFTAQIVSILVGIAERASRASLLLDAVHRAVKTTGQDPTVTRVSGPYKVS